VKSSKTRPGNRYLKGALGIAALSAARSRNTYFSAKHQRITARRGPMRAIVAVEHAMIIAAYTMLATGEVYRDPGTDHYTKHQPARTKARAITQLESLGYRVTLEPLAESA
jgi:transposase